MSNIIVSFLQPFISKDYQALVCYYEGMISELVKAGNNVMYINVHNLKSGNNYKNILKFKPDLIIAFNNQIPVTIIEKTDCPICIIASDTYHFFGNKPLINKYRDRYYIVTEDDGLNDFSKIVDLNHTTLINHATAVVREPSDMVNNISFIGGAFDYGLQQKHNKAEYIALLDYYKNHDFDKVMEKFDKIDCWRILDNRISVLTSLIELGLTIHGTGWSKQKNNNQLNLVIDDSPCFSLKHNQDVYNSSKINININHPQNKGKGFAWRCFDIMASNGLLISSYSEHLRELTHRYVDIPMYTSPLEAADLCRKFLQDEHLRQNLVYASNEFIRHNGKWETNFNILSQLTGVDINKRKGYGKIVNSELKYRTYNSVAKRIMFSISDAIKLIRYNVNLFKEKPNTEKIDNLVNRISERTLRI